VRSARLGHIRDYRMAEVTDVDRLAKFAAQRPGLG
jgi:hypothetical protein